MSNIVVTVAATADLYLGSELRVCPRPDHISGKEEMVDKLVMGKWRCAARGKLSHGIYHPII